jgi:hypothetical protein
MIGMGGFRLGSAARLSLVVLVAFFALALAAPAHAAFPGANGIRGDSDDRIFMTQGLFAP